MGNLALYGRGGGEYGIKWREAGSLHNKQNVFDDFIACAEHLIGTGYTSPAKLVTQVGHPQHLLSSHFGACRKLGRPFVMGIVMRIRESEDGVHTLMLFYGCLWCRVAAMAVFWWQPVLTRWVKDFHTSLNQLAQQECRSCVKVLA